MKKRIKEVIVVEGKTDTAVLKSLFDVDTIETHGLALSDQTLEMIKTMAESRGVIILTDPDYPGSKIRRMIVEAVPLAKHAFVAKQDAIGEKKLGIAEAKREAIVKAVEEAVTFVKSQESLSWEEFIDLGIFGDKKKRLKVYEVFHLGYGNAKTLYKRLNMAGITYDDVKNAKK